jgi:hypothetical protein
MSEAVSTIATPTAITATSVAYLGAWRCSVASSTAITATTTTTVVQKGSVMNGCPKKDIRLAKYLIFYR